MSGDTWDCQAIGHKIPDLRRLTKFLETYCKEEISELVSRYPEKKSIYIKLTDVLKFSSGLEQALVNDYGSMVIILRDAIENVSSVKVNNKKIKKEDIEFHIYNVPAMYKKSIPELDQKDIQKLICVHGLAKSVTDVEPTMKKTVFHCLRCGHNTVVDQEGLKFEEPFDGCENDTCGKRGPFKLLIQDSEFKNFQKIQLQESPDSARGKKSYNINLECYDELTGIVEPGDKITVTGILKVRQKSGKDGKSNLFQKIIEPSAIEKHGVRFEDYGLTQSDEEMIIELSKDPDIKEKICKSVAPSIYGHEEVKETIVLMLFSGVTKYLPDGTILRGRIHALLMGDPSTAKSQLARWLAEMSPRGIFTSGKTASAAGLTAAAVKNPLGEGWTIEGGAAVMASDGVLVIDEIGQISDTDKSALHEVMEHGTVNVSKAAVVVTLRAECSVLAVGNPKKGYFNRYEALPEQIGIPPALWSRFDLIFIILDEPNSNFDAAISDHILRNHLVGGMIQNRKHVKFPEFSEELIRQRIKNVAAPLTKETLLKYIAYARTRIFPVSTQETQEYIKNFYLSIREMKISQDTPVPITARSLEGVQRLAEASARMRLSNIITLEDAEFATKLIVKSLRGVGLDENGILDANLLNGLPSRSQQEKIKLITGYLKEEKTEKEVISLMKIDHKVPEDQTVGLIKKLVEKNVICINPSGCLKVTG